MAEIVTFGEIMGRLTPPDLKRFRQAVPGPIELTFAGAEATVAVTIALLGGRAAFVTALPKHEIADACVAALRGTGVDTSRILRVDEGRLGVYFYEVGVDQRPGRVVYDRIGSSVSLTPGEAYPWADIFTGAGWFHFSGITPAISERAASATFVAVREAKEHGLRVSCDLNYREQLWRWAPDMAPRDLAEQTMREVLGSCDLVIGSEYCVAQFLSIRAPGADADSVTERSAEVARIVCEQFPSVQQVAMTLRQSTSASHNSLGAMLYGRDIGSASFAPLVDGRYRPYEMRHIVDRLGTGDAFAGALLYALTTSELSAPSSALSFAAAAACLAHSIPGDFSFFSRVEVEALARGEGAGWVIR